MSRYALAPEARQDLADIRDGLSREASAKVMRRVMVQLVVAFRKIATTPGIGHVRLDVLDDERVLFWPAGDYSIVYRKHRRIIWVLAIVHSARDLHRVLTQRLV
jgi:antitoxin ParD1/3/4/toxin ParE1/3/4